MKKDLMKLVVNGFIKGVFIGYIITIIISSVVAGGEYVPCVPEFSSGYSNEIIPMAIQSILCGILGAIFMVANLIWRVDKWSLLKQTVVYLSITIGSILLIGNYLKWTKNIAIIGTHILIFLIIFVLIWLYYYFKYKKEIEEINRNI